MKHHPFTKLASIFVVCLMTFSSVAFADEAQLMDMVKSMQKQMSDLQSTMMAQKAEIQALKEKGAQVQNAPTGVEAAPPMSEYEFNQRMSDALGGANKWLKNLTFKGDLRLRYEGFHFDNKKTGATAGDQDRNRFRIRLRFGFEKAFNPEIKVGFSLATGDKSGTQGAGTVSGTSVGSGTATGNLDPISTNQTMGNLFNFKNIWVEKAYATYTPEWAKMGPVKGLEVTAGKFDNPFERGSTDMIWDRDLKPEGVFEKVDVELFKNDNLTLKGYGTAGQFILQETGTYGAKDSELFAYQLGLNPIFYVPGMERPVDALSALSVYTYPKYATNNNFKINPTTGVSQANGNVVNPDNSSVLDAQHFNVLSFYQDVAFYPYGVPVRPFFEWANNVSDASSAVQGQNNAWSIGTTVGKLQKKGDWQASYAYKWIGESAVVGAFNDSDFGGAYGGSGRDGSVFKAGYNLTDYLALNTAYFYVKPLNAGYPAFASTAANEAVNRFQVDMTYKF